jgi:hypothetical protein
MKLDELNPAAYNPRKTLAPGDAEYEQIKQSIITFGMVEPIVWNRQTGNIVGGHQRLTVLRDLGHETVEASVIDITEAQEKALNIALNKISGEWDDDKLTALLDELAADADEMLLSLTGFTQEELDEMVDTWDGGVPPSQEEDGGEGDAPSSRETGFTYQEQFGVIVLCKDEDEQRTVYEQLAAQGFSCRVVAT